MLRSSFDVASRGLARAAVAFATAAAISLPLVPHDAFARSAPTEGFADLAQRLSPAVVNISTTQNVRRGQPLSGTNQGQPGPFDDFLRQLFPEEMQRRGPGAGPSTPRRASSLGSGFVIDANGTIVTNNHVIEDADEIQVNFEDGTSLKAKIVARDELADLAVLKVAPKRPLTFVRFGNSDQARVGDWVVAIGNPFGFGGSVTAGIISAFNRDIGAGQYDDFIQTDAAINRGNSGGPLFDLDGEVIGINSAIISPSGGSIGLGFAIPANSAKRVIDQLVKFGETRRGWIGVKIQSVTPEIAESLGLDQPAGALVAEVTPGGPADRAGVKVGDLILKFDGKAVTAMRSLPRLVAETEIGRTVQVDVLRDKKRYILAIQVGRLDPKQMSQLDDRAPKNGMMGDRGSGDVEILGLQLSRMTPSLRREFGISGNTDGVVVANVDPDGPAADELRPGDIILEVDQQRVRTPQDVEAAIKKAKSAKKRVALFMVNRGGSSEFHGVRLGDD
ncbi:MAG: DegQ family serine endoprotease [Alphaproteobacteria bacterium]